MHLPPALLQSLQGIKGFNEQSFTALHENSEQITSVRLNPSKLNSIGFDAIDTYKIPWSSNGYYLSARPSFIQDPLWHAGAYYVQEASSMFLEQALQQTVDLTKPIKVLDLCAAPGGKSTLIQSLINTESILVSNEVIKTRVNVLAENIIKWGACNVVVTNNDPKDFKKITNYFDVIVIDAPCSGSGLFRKDEKAINEWSEANVALCSLRQQRIIADVYDSLKKDGILIYSTCSYSKQENEEMLDWIGEQFNVCRLQLNLADEWGIVETQSDTHQNYGYRFYPDKVKGEGFFIAAFKKNDESNSSSTSSKNKVDTPPIKEIEVIKNYLQQNAAYNFIKQNDEIIALPSLLFNELSTLQSLYIKKAGVKIGTVIKNELIPHHELALNNWLTHNIPSISVNDENALQYLRKQEIRVQTPNIGWTLIRYQNLALGWVKVLPNRINNYYPSNWRILNK
ncbi:MAG: RNA methyltransferase [Ferruginibacter sp.]|nr:RNA methyltransferase [Ferruginibacter sp.]